MRIVLIGQPSPATGYSPARRAALALSAKKKWPILEPPSSNATRIGIQTPEVNLMQLEGKVAVITGAATGIGQAIAMLFAQAGAQVAVDYVGDAAAANDTIDKINSAGGKAIAIAADVSHPDQVAALIQQTVAAFGKLDILVNNAGIEKKLPFVDYPFDE
jgi:hypothetical protein